MNANQSENKGEGGASGGGGWGEIYTEKNKYKRQKAFDLNLDIDGES